jgi:hypothetical protein
VGRTDGVTRHSVLAFRDENIYPVRHAAAVGKTKGKNRGRCVDALRTTLHRDSTVTMLTRVPIWPRSPFSAELLARPINELAPDEVFVFGSNRRGFHGAGAAGLALRGDAGTGWRHDLRFLAMSRSPAGSPGRIGNWAVFGVGRGHQVGRSGQSYAIETIEWPGREYRRGRPLGAIATQLQGLVVFAREHYELRFLITPIGEGFSGYTRDEMGHVWRGVHAACGGLPASFRFVRLARDSCELT